MSYNLILPFFPEEIRALLLDPTISDLMINGTSGVYALLVLRLRRRPAAA